MVEIYTIVKWNIPTEINENISNYDGINIYRSSFEDGNYTQLNNTLLPLNTSFYEDTTTPVSVKDTYFYAIRFHLIIGGESPFYTAYTQLSPREQRLGNALKSMLSPFLSYMLTDADISAGLQYGLKIFNEIPVRTYFTISSLPKTLEPIVLALSGIFAFFLKYTSISLTDISYNDNGLNLTIDRGSKVKNAIDVLQAFVDKYIAQMKWNYMTMGTGLGSIPLPIGLGGKLSGALLNILDIFNAVGR